MTFIQPNKNNSIVNGILVVLSVGVLGGIFLLVGLYNNTVNISHTISAAKAELDAISAENTSMNNTVIAALGNSQIAAFAGANNLVQDKNPQYLPVDPKWLLASQY
jgi:cell division protein FtsB